MAIELRAQKEFTAAELERLFLSVGWLSGRYPERLVKAMRGSATVISAWDGAKLVGLVNALDDGELTAYVHYLLVDPAYHGQGLGKQLIEAVKRKYADYLYLLLIPEERRNVEFYRRLGFAVAEGATPMQIMTL